MTKEQAEELLETLLVISKSLASISYVMQRLVERDGRLAEISESLISIVRTLEEANA